MDTIRCAVILVDLLVGSAGFQSARAQSRAASFGAFAVGDCNNNGTPDAQENAWGNRDDDGDGVCNGIDNCPDEPNADQATVANGTGAACQMQAITVPAVPANPAAPHVTFSGATVTLKGIARYGGDQFMWDFDDGSPSTGWTAITDPYNLGVAHSYTGSVGARFTATLSVRNSTTPAVVATAAYPVILAAATDLSDPAQVRVRAQMAVDQGLWYLHLHETRSTSADGAPGYRQPFGSWSTVASGCAAVDAFEQHRSLPQGDRRSDPYVEDVRRGLNTILAGGSATAINPQAHGNPDVNGNGLGVELGGPNFLTHTLVDGVCGLALAHSGAPSRHAGTGATGIYDRTYASIAQDVVDWFAYGQVDTGGGEGGWGYYGNDSGAEMNNTAWPILALLAAESKMGATVPAFVRTEAVYFLNFVRSNSLDAGNGASGWQTNYDLYKTVATTAGGIAGLTFVGIPVTDFRLKQGLGFVYRDWNGLPAYAAQDNVGDSFSMYLLANALTGFGISRVIEFDYTHGVQTANSFDWFFTPAGQTQTGYGTYLVSHQGSDGSWAPGVGALGADAYFPGDSAAVTAFDTVVLENAPGVCGNALVEVGEQCDLGAANGTATACCTSTCQYKPANAACDDGNACTLTDSCLSGVCTGLSAVTCTASDSCHVAGTCNPANGMCSNPAAPDGTGCDDLNACTNGDACTAGVCHGSPLPTPDLGNDLLIARSANVAILAWSDPGGTYNVYRGSLPGTGPWSYNHTCFANDTNPPTEDPALPPFGVAGWYYLVSRVGLCSESALGRNSFGSAIPNFSPCP